MRVIVLSALMLFATSAKADTLHVDAFGSFFGGQQTFTTSFDWDTVGHTALDNSLTFISTGAFNGFALIAPITPRFANFANGDWENGAGNFFQVDFWKYLTPFNNPPSFDSPGEFPETLSLYTCPSCAVVYNRFNGTHRAEEGSYMTVTNVPEPSTLAMLVLGLVLLYVLYCYNSKVGNVVQLVRGKW